LCSFLHLPEKLVAWLCRATPDVVALPPKTATRAAEPPVFAFTTLRSVNLPLVGFTAEPRNEGNG
jgi:hypothetical protein